MFFESKRAVRQRSSIGAVLAGLAVMLIGMAPAFAQQSLLEQIKAENEITIGTEARYAPFEFIRDGDIVGYDRDLLARVMQAMPEVEVNTLNLPWQGILPGLSQGKLDMVVTAVVMTPERAERYRLTVPLADASVGLMVANANDAIQKPADIAGATVAAQAGSAQLETLTNYSEKLANESGDGAGSIKEYVSVDQAYQDLANGRIDAVAVSLPNLLYVAKQHPDRYRVLDKTIGPKAYFAWAGRRDEASESLVQFFDEQLLKLKESGEMAELQKKWFGKTMDLPGPGYTPGE